MRSRPILQAGAVAGLLLVAAAAAGLVVRAHWSRAGDDESRRLATVTAALHRTVLDDVDAVSAVGGRLGGARPMSAPGFAAMGRGVLAHRPSLDAVIYAASAPADRVPITFAATRPDSATPGPPGTDLAADPARMAALRAARDTGTVQASRPVAVPGGGGTSVAVFSPVYRGGAVPPTLAARRAAVTGYAVAVVRLDRMERALAAALPPGLRYAIADHSTATPLVTDDPGPHAASRELDVAGRDWQVSVARGGRGVPLLAWALLTAGLAGAVLLGAWFRGAGRVPGPAEGRGWRAAMVRLRRGV